MLISVPSALFGATRTLFGNSKIHALMLRPYLIGFGTTLCSLVVFFIYRESLAATFFGESWLAVTSTLLFLVNIFTSSVIGLLAILIFKELYLPELLGAAADERLPDVPRSSLSFTSSLLEIACRLTVLSILGALSLVSLLIPIASPVLFICGAWYIGQDSIMSSLSLLGHPLRRQLSLTFARPLEVLGIGVVCWLCLLIPLAGILFLPFTYLVGLEVVRRWRLQGVLGNPSPQP
jgi:hypothetical protein